MKAILLAGGKGEKIWPYNEVRNKCMVPVSNRPIISYLVDGLKKNHINDITIIGSAFMDEVKHYFRHHQNISVIEINETKGNVETLMQANIQEEFIFLYGDCIIHEEDLKHLLSSQVNTVLLGKVRDDCHHHILGLPKNDEIQSFIAYPRGYEEGYFVAGGHFDTTFLDILPYNRGRFKNTKVGVGSPNEKIIEESLNDFIEKHPLHYVMATYPIFDIDKPWQILEANAFINTYRCKQITENQIDSTALIDPSARIDGFIQLGQHSKIGKNVHIKGNIIVGDDTIIDQGAVIEENCVIGDRCQVLNHCKLGSQITIGNDCIIEHTAEMIGGMLMDKNYLYHHGEFFGLCGERCDLGAGSICGTLRFDDGETVHKIQGRKEIPAAFSNATFLGDYTRAGVGVIFLPGATVGTNCVIGAGTILNRIVKSNTLIYPKQELIEKEWSYKKYGW